MSRLWILLLISLCIAGAQCNNGDDSDSDSELIGDLEDILNDIDTTLAVSESRGLSFKQIKEAAKVVFQKLKVISKKFFKKVKKYAKENPEVATAGLEYVYNTITTRIEKAAEESKDAEVTTLMLKLAQKICKSIYEHLKEKINEDATSTSAPAIEAFF